MSTAHPARSLRDAIPMEAIRAPASRVAFYSAIALPAVYLPLLVTGIETTDGLTLFLGLLGLHLVTLVAGRSYHEDRA